VADTLAEYPTLRSTRLYDMLRARGYTGSARSVRRYVAMMRPRPPREAYQKLEHLIGDQAQVDWAHVGEVHVGPGRLRKLWLFVMALSYSRAFFAEFTFDTGVHGLIRSLGRAVQWFGGTPRQWLFDNTKAAVLERFGGASRFTPAALEFAANLHVQLRLCRPRKGNEKGIVERRNRFLRDRFLAGRPIPTPERGNQELLTFIEQNAHPMKHPDLPGKTVAACFEEERPRLLPLPVPFPVTAELRPVAVDKTAFARFDTNAYSVPSRYAQQTITLRADDDTVAFIAGEQVVAQHARSWDKHQRVVVPEHHRDIWRSKPGAMPSGGRATLLAIAPNIEPLFERWLKAERNVGSLVAQCLKILDLYTPEIFAAAVNETVERGNHDPGQIGIVCERLRRQADRPPPIDVPLGDHVPDRDVIPHDLEKYDG